MTPGKFIGKGCPPDREERQAAQARCRVLGEPQEPKPTGADAKAAWCRLETRTTKTMGGEGSAA
jgi:hypothetical protein